MEDLYKKIESLCKGRGITIGKMCSEIKISRGNISDLKTGRRKTLSQGALLTISKYFDVSIDFLLGNTNDPTPENGKRPVYDDEAWAMMREMYERPELRALFKTTKNVKPEDIKAVDDLLKRMAGVNEDDS